MKTEVQDTNKYRYWTQFLLQSQRVLLLQGPVGPFFSHLRTFLVSEGKFVYKINFNGGDQCYYPIVENSHQFTAPITEFHDYLSTLIQSESIDSVICFGDRRPYHQIAQQVCKEKNCSFWAFEEGYLRPHYVTFEQEGVNFSSIMSRDPDFYQEERHKLDISAYHYFKPKEVASGFWRRAWQATNYYLAMWHHSSQFPNYQHHRSSSPLLYLSAWIKAGVIKAYYSCRDVPLKKRIESGVFPPFFIFPLQVHNDSQIRFHGRKMTVAQYIRFVMRSFAQSSPSSLHLVIKHHPMDRGFSHYGRLIQQLIKRYHLEGRIHYCFEIPMPVLLRHARGMVVVNSTTGISALIHKLPVKILGDAHYDIPGITSTQSLAEFWSKPIAPNKVLVEAYLANLWYRTQINGNFYQRDFTLVQDDFD